MKLKNSKLIKKDKISILENLKQAKIYLSQGKLSKDDLELLIKSSPDIKYVGWMSKIWFTEKPDIDDLRNTVEEYDTFVKRGKVKTRDINQFKSFKALQDEISQINASSEGTSSKDLESDYETVLDNSDLLIMSPHTHEASRKLGLSYFSFRNCEGGGKDSAWCTTYKAPDHFISYYHTQNITFYYVKVKSPKLIDELKSTFPKKYKELQVVALVVHEDGKKIDGYDGKDKKMSSEEIKKFTNIIGIS